MNRNCIKCGVALVIGVNTTQRQLDNHAYICRECRHEYERSHHVERTDWRHRTGRQQPMNENKQCASFLGVHVAEQVLSHVFKNVQRMPYGNPGFDFICGGGYEIDVKSACRSQDGRSNNWKFHIFKNRVAKYFLCLAFDNRKDLNPEHIWLIPGGLVNHLIGLTISMATLQKWEEYALDISKVSACCDIIRGT